jgi:hypothetical protein
MMLNETDNELITQINKQATPNAVALLAAAHSPRRTTRTEPGFFHSKPVNGTPPGDHSHPIPT